jgi:acyl-CoA synthetase (AMP-forming)/AMP-acid ligase II
LLLEAVQGHPDRVALVGGAGQLTFAELSAAAERLAQRMHTAASRGGEAPDLRGARVAVVAPNVPGLLVALLAVWRLEAVAVPLSGRLRERELSLTLGDAEPALILSVPAHLGYSFVDLLERLLPELPTARGVLFLDALAEVQEERQGLGARSWEPLPAELAAILYTSGTTGLPKGALVTHAREAEGARHHVSELGLTPEDRVALVVPATHAFGFTCLLGAASAGVRAILVESSTSPRPVLEAIEREQATVLHGSPTLFTSLLKAAPERLAGVRGFVAGASPSEVLLEQLDGAGMRILNLYGLTETGIVSSCRFHDPPRERHTTAGRPLPGFELRLAEADEQEAQLAELQLRGPSVTPGYHQRPAETAEAFATDGWFRTGDLATFEDGYLRIAGRVKELVNVGGFNVFPAEVEAVLLAHPDVLQAAVVGVADERTGEALRAFVVPCAGSDLTPARLLGFARERIAGYKLPYVIQLLPELPALPSGKPDRLALRGKTGPDLTSPSMG